MPSDSATLAVAVVGACTGVGSLAWQVASWRRSGPDLRVECSENFDRNEQTGAWDRRVLDISVFNRGRGDVQVVSAVLRFRSPRFRAIHGYLLTNALDLPLTIEGQHGASWRVPLEQDDLPPRLGDIGALTLRLGSGRQLRQRFRAPSARGSWRNSRL